jgi:hypothetical protein
MNRDGEIVITGGAPIGFAVMAVGIATGIEEITLTGVGFAGAAVLIAGLFQWADPETDTSLADL